MNYVVGFLFTSDRSRVALIRKTHPEWQRGRLNGIGGKIRSDESPDEAMRREFREEAGLDVDGWRYYLALSGPQHGGWKIPLAQDTCVASGAVFENGTGNA